MHLQTVFKQCLECLLAAAIQDQCLLQNDTIALLSINSAENHSISLTKQSSSLAVLSSFGLYHW